MENLRVAFLALLALCAPSIVAAYAVPTHRGLTDTTIKAYEQFHGDTFTNSETAKIVQGNADEDAHPRYSNHFYDPINGTGLRNWYGAPIGFLTHASKQWAQDTMAQAEFLCIVKSKKDDIGCIGAYGHGYEDKRFSSPTDFSWDRAVYEYAWGDKERGVESLGHVIHLIQDATVPAHVRNDDHTGGDTYEDYSARFNQGNIVVPSALKPSYFSSINDAFGKVASYSNLNFVSDDTVFNRYPRPILSELTLRDGYAYGTNGLPIVRVRNQYVDGEYINEQTVDDAVVIALWPHLSKKAIEAGMGVIDLFFRAVEEEKMTGRLKAMNASQAETDRKNSILKGFNVAKLLYGSSLSQSDVEELLGETGGQAGSAALAVSQPSSSTNNSEPVQAQAEPVRTKVDEPEQVQQEEVQVFVPETVETSVASTTTATSTEPQLFQDLVPVVPGFGGGGGSTAGSSESEPTPAVSPVPLIVSSPVDGSFFATTSIQFTGTTEANGLIEVDTGTSTANTTADSDGNWSVDVELEEGNSSVTVEATDTEGERVSSTIVSVWVDLTPPALAVIDVGACDDSLSSSFCLVATSSVNVVWADVPDATNYAMYVDTTLGATSSATSSSVSVPYGATTTISVVSYDQAGNSATSTSVLVYSIERPLMISEVAWAGTDANDADEWIELKNVSAFTLDLSEVSISIDGATSTLTGVLNAGAYYLIEDRAETTSKPHDLTLDMDLLDSGATVAIQDMDENTIDQTPVIAACSGWCAGSTSATIGTSIVSGNLTAKLTMERIDETSDGTLASSWQNNDTYIRTSSSKASDSAGGIVYGTPAVVNSSGLPSAGWNCGDGTIDATYADTYNPTSSFCTYLSAFISTQANRFSIIFKGTVGSSTSVSSHSMSKSIQSDQNDSGLLTGALAGDQFFVAMFETRTGPAFTDPADFARFFTGTAANPPHSNYVVIPWTYSP